jgi:DNA-directed RNA polymerase specialized sigma24 family protein
MGDDKKYRKRTIEYHEEGHSILEMAKIFGIPLSSFSHRLKLPRSPKGATCHSEALG